MQFRKHYHDTTDLRENPPSTAPASDDTAEFRQAGQSLFQAADEAIRRALSGDSQKFLEATRQEGGQ
jgi:hypothetical protein